jgi:hypothetical protein
VLRQSQSVHATHHYDIKSSRKTDRTSERQRQLLSVDQSTLSQTIRGGTKMKFGLTKNPHRRLDGPVFRWSHRRLDQVLQPRHCRNRRVRERGLLDFLCKLPTLVPQDILSSLSSVLMSDSSAMMKNTMPSYIGRK